jgi:hypothetical protein
MLALMVTSEDRVHRLLPELLSPLSSSPRLLHLVSILAEVFKWPFHAYHSEYACYFVGRSLILYDTYVAAITRFSLRI